MSTPLDLRNRRREAQRAVRLAVNAINASLDIWKAAVTEGKRRATALTNAVLTQLHLPALPLGMLSDVPGLLPAAEAKLREQQEAALQQLAACLEQLEQAVMGLADAAASLQQLLDREAESPLLVEAAVFAMLPLRLLGGMVAEVAHMHQTELAVKTAVLEGFQQIIGDLRAAEQAGVAGAAPSSAGAGRVASSSSGTGREAARREEQLRKMMQVYVTAWLLAAEVDERRVEAHLAAVAADMRGF